MKKIEKNLKKKDSVQDALNAKTNTGVKRGRGALSVNTGTRAKPVRTKREYACPSSFQ